MSIGNTGPSRRFCISSSPSTWVEAALERIRAHRFSHEARPIGAKEAAAAQIAIEAFGWVVWNDADS